MWEGTTEPSWDLCCEQRAASSQCMSAPNAVSGAPRVPGAPPTPWSWQGACCLAQAEQRPVWPPLLHSTHILSSMMEHWNDNILGIGSQRTNQKQDCPTQVQDVHCGTSALFRHYCLAYISLQKLVQSDCARVYGINTRPRRREVLLPNHGATQKTSQMCKTAHQHQDGQAVRHACNQCHAWSK